jgi:hypothetical protein
MKTAQKATKERRVPVDMSFNIGGDDRPRKRTSDIDSPTRKKKKNTEGSSRKVGLESDLDDARFVDDRPRPPKPKKGKKRSAETVEHLRPLKKAKKASSAPSAPGTALVLTAAPLKKRMSRLSKQAQESILGQDAEDIQQMLENDQTDQALRYINKRLLQACVDMIAQIETGIRESNGRYGVHSFNGLITSIRELMIDLQATQDRGAIGETLTKDIIQPSYRDIGLEVMKEYSLILDDAKTLADNVADSPRSKQEALTEFRQRQVESRTRIGQYLQNSFFTVRDDLIGALQR